MSAMEPRLRKWIEDSLGGLSRALPIQERTRAVLRAQVLRRLPWLMPNLARPGFLSSSDVPLWPAGDAADYFIWGLIDWHFRLQRPQQLALCLAASGRRVFFISSTLVDSAEPGFRVEPLDDKGRLFQIFLQVRGVPSIYFSLPSARAERQLEASLEALVDWSAPFNPISLVEHPFWRNTARSLRNSRLIYDRMDFHQGFGTFFDDLIESERALMAEADLTVVSSDWLDRDSAQWTPRRIVIRNGADYDHFAECPDRVYRDARGRRVIGYYGAIANWMDLELVGEVAGRFENCSVLLIGHDQVGARKQLARYANVQLLGEVEYGRLPFYLYGFDVCLLPRRILPLTEAMNPVKLYEYVSAGRPVVAIDLPELEQFGDLVYTATSPEGFLAAVASALAESPEDQVVVRRRAFAAQQTWSRRTARLIEAVESLLATRTERR